MNEHILYDVFYRFYIVHLWILYSDEVPVIEKKEVTIYLVS